LIIINVIRASNHHIKMISEGNLKTGVMAAKIQLCHRWNKLNFQIENCF